MRIGIEKSIIGNAEGKGIEREEELIQVMQQLQVERTNVIIMHNPSFQDGMSEEWNITLLKTAIGTIIEKKNISHVFTFDSYGVSGHKNHKDLYRATYELYYDEQKRRIFNLYTLQSTNLLTKYIGLFSLVKLIFSHFHQKQPISIIQYNPFQTLIYLRYHRSQLTWYRILYSICSQYTYLNKWNHFNA